MDGGQPEAETAIKVWRGEALNAWKAGVDGIYTFNRFNPHDPSFRELGDPDLLETLDRIDQTRYVANMWSRPEVWLKNGDKFVKESPASCTSNLTQRARPWISTRTPHSRASTRVVLRARTEWRSSPL